MITATSKRIPVKLIAWDEDSWQATVQNEAGRVRVVAFSDLHATGGYRELLMVIHKCMEAQRRLEQEN